LEVVVIYLEKIDYEFLLFATMCSNKARSGQDSENKSLSVRSTLRITVKRFRSNCRSLQ